MILKVRSESPIGDRSSRHLRLGGVYHCSLHCRLAKFLGLMYLVRYSAVIGRETRFFVCAQ